MIKSLIERLKSSDFVVNITKLTSATSIGQLVTILTAPVLYRIYDKTAYGTLGLYMAITGVIGVFSTLQYLQTILLEKKKEDAITALWLNRVINTSFALFTLLLVALFHQPIAGLLKNPAIHRWLWLIPLSIFFAGQNDILRVWANRYKEYNILTLNGILTSVLIPICSITLGFILKDNDLGLFVGLFAGQCAPALILFFSLSRKHDFGKLSNHYTKLLPFAKQNSMFPVYSLPSEFINQFTNQLPVFMLNQFAGAGAVGIYNLAVRMLSLPIMFIGQAISTVFQQRAVRDYNEYGSCRPIFLKTLKTLSVISIVPIITILLFGPRLFGFVFGEEWITSGRYAQVLILLFSSKLIVSPLSYMFFIAKRLKEDFYWHIWMLVSNAVLFTVLFKLEWDIRNILLIYAVNYLVIYIVYLFRSYQFTTVNIDPIEAN